MFTACKTQLARYLHRLVEARRLKVEHEQAFYRNLIAYWRANNLSPICEEDWKTAAYDKTNDEPSMIARKEMCHGQER